MYNRLRCMLVILLLLLVPSLAAASPLVRIGLVNGKNAVTISGQRPFQIVNLSDGSLIATGHAGQKWQFTYVDGQMRINNRQVEGPVIFRLEPGDENEFLTVDGRRYHGDIEVRPSVTKKGITVIEILPVEEYVYGVIPWEISPAWSMEAVKAQAVAARTYALYNLGKHKNDGFDLCNTTDCQVYGGRESEDPRGNFAVDATRGMVVTYKNKLVSTFFHSSSGGYTEHSENVWGGKSAYLRAVPDFDQDSPYYHWKVSFSTEEIASRLQPFGYNIGTLQGIKVSPLSKGINDAPDRGVSGRIKTVTFMGSERNVTLEGTEVRRIFKLHSTMFDIAPTDIKKESTEPSNASTSITIGTDKVEAKQTIEASVPIKKKKSKKKKKPVDAESQTVSTPIAPKPAMENFAQPVTANLEISVGKPVHVEPKVHLLTSMSAGMVTFEGRGSGHGLGMSQWGAKAMAEKGPQDDRTYYQQILRHYYQGVDITKWY